MDKVLLAVKWIGQRKRIRNGRVFLTATENGIVNRLVIFVNPPAVIPVVVQIKEITLHDRIRQRRVEVDTSGAGVVTSNCRKVADIVRLLCVHTVNLHPVKSVRFTVKVHRVSQD